MISQILNELQKYTNPEKAEFLPKYFDTKLGEKDFFLSVMVPDTRFVAKKYKDRSLQEVEKLLQNKFHEARLAALFILVEKFKKAEERERKEIVDLYLTNTKYINNWDLVDTSAAKILGEYLVDKSRDLLYSLSRSSNLWERRIAIISTIAFIKRKEVEDSFALAKILLNDQSHYIHKAVGWVLRDTEKVDRKQLEQFLQENYSQIPRTTLRYAIEHFTKEERERYLKGGF